MVAPGRDAHDCFQAASAHSGLRCLADLAGFSELNPQIARDVRQTALAGPPMLHDRYPQDAGAVLGS